MLINLQLRMIEGYLHSLNQILDTYKEQSTLVLQPDTSHVETALSDLTQATRELERFLKQFSQRDSDSATRKVMRMISWRNYREELSDRCNSLQTKRLALESAVSLLTSAIGYGHFVPSIDLSLILSGCHTLACFSLSEKKPVKGLNS